MLEGVVDGSAAEVEGEPSTSEDAALREELVEPSALCSGIAVVLAANVTEARTSTAKVSLAFAVIECTGLLHDEVKHC